MSAVQKAATGLRRRSAALALALVVLIGPGSAQDQFSFMPAGGQELLAQVLETCEGCDGLETLSGNDWSAQEWRDYFDGHAAFDGLTEPQVGTLINYLAINFPTEAGGESAALPRGGRQIAITNCQLCHSLAVPMTQTRTLDRWLQHGGTAPHDGLRLSDSEWETLAHYLTNNAPIPLESIPEQLRRGAGGY